MTIWAELTHAEDKHKLLNNMLTGAGVGDKQYIPLQFWFCRNPGLALPLIALQYHEVKLNVMFASANNAGTAATGTFSTCVFCDYIFLDTDERRRFAQVSHEYLIEQVQFSNNLKINKDAKSTANLELRFNHPVKELVWVGDNDGQYEFADCLLQLNGHDRFRKRAGSYFRTVQRYEHHSGNTGNSQKPHIYSFALKPEEHQPSGTCNFSRIDNAVLVLTNDANTASDDGNCRVYAVNYNVLRIMSGMGGLAYSN
jgi:hypothetical protein